MAKEKELVSMAQQFTGLPMESLIGGPLNAAAQANSAMAITQTRFLLDTCFYKEKDDKDAPYIPIMVSMEQKRGVIVPSAEPGGEPVITEVTTTFNLPILTILPLNSLAVDDVTIKFDMEVKSSYGEEESSEASKKLSTESSFESRLNLGCFSASVTGSVSYNEEAKSSQSSHYEKSNTASYSVNVHAGQLPLPLGVTTIIQAFTNAIEPIILPTE